jgi:hypothetical protein
MVKMKSFRQHLHEIFNSTPIPLTMVQPHIPKNSGGAVWNGNWSVNGKRHSFEAYARPIKSDDEITGWVFGFTVDDEASAPPNQEAAMKSETGRIFATAIEALRQLVKEYSPKMIRFTAAKEGKKNDSRVRLYNSMVKRFAGQQGYRLKDQSETPFVQLYVLVKQ